MGAPLGRLRSRRVSAAPHVTEGPRAINALISHGGSTRRPLLVSLPDTWRLPIRWHTRTAPRQGVGREQLRRAGDTWGRPLSEGLAGRGTHLSAGHRRTRGCSGPRVPPRVAGAFSARKCWAGQERNFFLKRRAECFIFLKTIFPVSVISNYFYF